MLMKVNRSRLASGAEVATTAISHVESVAVGVWVGVGSRYESKKTGGMSHFIEHMLFKGTNRRSARDISVAIEGRGGYLNAFTQEESTCYYARVSYDHLESALDVLSDMYIDPLLDQQDLTKERGVIVEEIMMYRDQPQYVVQEMLGRALWPDHPLGRPIAGTPESLATIDRKSMLEFKNGHYVPGNTLFAFAGKLDHAACVGAVERMTRPDRASRAPSFRKVVSSTGQKALLLETKEIEQTHVALGLRIFGKHDKRRFALRVLNAILGENMSSRLFQVVREKHGLAYSVHSSLHLFDETGAMVVSAGLDRKRSMEAVGLIVKEMRKFKEHRVGAGELKRGKDFVVGQMRLQLESTTNQMMWLAESIMSYGRFVPPEEAMENVLKVSADDIQSLAADIMKTSAASLSVVSPAMTGRDEPGLRNCLAGL